MYRRCPAWGVVADRLRCRPAIGPADIRCRTDRPTATGDRSQPRRAQTPNQGAHGEEPHGACGTAGRGGRGDNHRRRRERRDDFVKLIAVGTPGTTTPTPAPSGTPRAAGSIPRGRGHGPPSWAARRRMRWGAFCAAGCVSFQAGTFDAVGNRNPVTERVRYPRLEWNVPGYVRCPCQRGAAGERTRRRAGG